MVVGIRLDKVNVQDIVAQLGYWEWWNFSSIWSSVGLGQQANLALIANVLAIAGSQKKTRFFAFFLIIIKNANKEWEFFFRVDLRGCCGGTGENFFTPEICFLWVTFHSDPVVLWKAGLFFGFPTPLCTLALQRWARATKDVQHVVCARESGVRGKCGCTRAWFCTC